MRILLVSEYFPDSLKKGITGGVESRCFNVAKNLSGKNEVTVLTSWRTGLKREEKFAEMNVKRVGEHHPYSNSAGFSSRLKLASVLVEEGKKLQPDIIDAYNYTTYIPAFKIGKFLDKPVVATYHETWVGEWVKNKGIITGVPYEIYERLILRKPFDTIIIVSEFTRNRLIKQGVPKNKIIVIHNGIETDELKVISAKKIPNTVCFAGRLIPTKNVDVLLRAITLVKKKIPGIKCIIIGQGEQSGFLKNLAIDLGIESNVEFKGFIKSHDKAMETLKSSMLFCSPSTVEGFGITLLEAMTLRVPYVCTDIEPFSEVTEGGKGGMLFTPGKHSELSEKIIRLLTDKDLYEQKVAEEKVLVKKYDWKPIADRIEKVYDIILKNR